MTTIYNEMPDIQFNLSSLKSYKRSHTDEELGHMVRSVIDALTRDIEPTFSTEGDYEEFEDLFEHTKKKADAYFEQVNAGRFGKQGGRPRKGETKEEYQERKAKENTPTVGTIPPNEDFDNKPVEPINTPEPIKESAPTSKAPETAPNEAKIPCMISTSEGYSQQNEEIYIETLFKTIWEQRNSELSDIYVQLQGNSDWTTYYHRLKTIMSSYNLQKDVERQVLNKIEAYLKDNYNNQLRIQATA